MATSYHAANLYNLAECMLYLSGVILLDWPEFWPMMALMSVYLIDLEDYNGLLGPGSMVAAAGAINRWPISQREQGERSWLTGRKHEHTTIS
jgi:hypothetical protein